MSNPLGPKSFEDIFTETFKIYKKLFLILLFIMLIMQVIDEVFAFAFLPRIPKIDPEMKETFESPPIFKMLSYLFIYGILTMITTFIKGAIITWIVSCHFLGENINIGKAFQFAKRRLGTLAGAAVLYLLGLTGLFITIFGIPFSIYFMVSWGFAVQTCTLERFGPKKSLKRSSWLVEDNWWRVAGIILALTVVRAVVYVPLLFIPIVGRPIGAILTSSIIAIGGILLYFDLRVRKEGYDLEKLSEELGIKPVI